MSRNAGESRIPLPRTVKPSLLPKLRSLGPPKIGSANHRRHSPSSVYCPNNNKQQQQQQQQQSHYVFGRLQQVATTKPSNNKQFNDQSAFEPNKADLVSADQIDLSISALWDATKDNKEAEHLMRLSNEQLSLFRSQEELAQEDPACLKRRQPSYEEFDLEFASSRQQQEEASSKHQQQQQQLLESPSVASGPPHYLMLQTKQNSFEHDESSLGILTPDQMTDFTVALESSRTPSCENLSARDSAGNFLLQSKSNALVAAAARHLDIVASVPAPISPNDRSPSFEELPLDPRPGQPLVAGNSNDDEDSSSLCAEDEALLLLTERGRTPLSAKTSAAKPLPTSFVTSVTSITSLEAGYQGDGENSRPASRGAEPLSLLPSALGLGTHAERGLCKQDPMTDSDFFTESDADEVVRGAGDRRAQVIDGTLFCAQSAERRCPGGFEPAEEMDSSGIYSDLDKRQDNSSGLELEPEPEEPYAEGDHATDTADTGDTGDTEISVRSQPSPQETTPTPALVTNNMLTPDVLNDTLDSNSTVSTAEVTVIKCQKNEQNAATRTKSNSLSNKENSAPLKKYKMPKRNVISKIKTMIEANQTLLKEETESEPKRVHRQQRKNGRWDAVMNKIEAGKQRGRALKKEVKSRVLQGLPNSTTSSTASTSSTRHGTIDTNSNSSSSNNKDKRRMRGRPETSCSNQELARSSLRSSASDLSSTHSKEAPKRPSRKNCIETATQLQQPNNNQMSSNLTKSKSNLSTVRKAASIKSVQSVNVKQKNTTTNKVSERTQPPRTAAAHKQLSAVINNNNNCNNNNNNNNNNQHRPENESISNNNNSNSNNNNNNVVVVAVADEQVKPSSKLLESREQQVQTEDQSQDWSKKAEDTVQALAITVQYFTHQLHLEDLTGARLRQQLDTMKTEWLSTSSELEELRLDKASIEEALNHERNQHLHRLQNLTHELEQERTQRSSLEKRLQEERRQIERLQVCLEEHQREEKILQERLLAEQDLQLSRSVSGNSGSSSTQQLQQQQQQQDPNGLLAAEVESLRTVLEIRSQENGQLRAEVDLLRRELDDKEQLRLKCESLEARCEDLKAQLNAKEESDRQLGHENEKLLASIHQLSKQNKRLSQRNEELLWRLRQKNEVVSVLTNQLTPQSQQRLSKSLQPSSSNSQLETTTCSMKYMVEKGDSVSWTLDISDSFETCHSQNLGLSNSSSSSCCSASRRHLSSASNGSLGPNSRARSNSTSVVDRPAKSAKTSLSHNDSQAAPTWKPNYQSTPLQRRRNDHSWSLSNTLTETASSQEPNACSAKAAAALQVSTDDDDDDEDDDDAVAVAVAAAAAAAGQHDDEVESLGQRPQEAGGEAMISEETSTSSSSEDDESSVSSGDIP